MARQLFIRGGYQREWNLCRPGKIVQAPANRMNFIKDDSYNILASLTATFVTPVTAITSRRSFTISFYCRAIRPLRAARFSPLKVLKFDKLIRFTPCYYVSRAEIQRERKIAGKRASQISLLRVRRTSKRRSKCECRIDSCITRRQ